jgi:hypothetical protein
MIDKKDLVIVILVGFILAVTLYPKITASVKEYDPWIDTNDDGKINVIDIFAVAKAFGSEGTPINKTALLLELLDRVEALENQSLPQGVIGTPAYDSGWVYLETGAITLSHNLNTNNALVFMAGRNETGAVSHWDYGGNDNMWYDFTNTTITLESHNQWDWKYVRVMIWKIQEPPT